MHSDAKSGLRMTDSGEKHIIEDEQLQQLASAQLCHQLPRQVHHTQGHGHSCRSARVQRAARPKVAGAESRAAPRLQRVLFFGRGEIFHGILGGIYHYIQSPPEKGGAG